MTRKDFVVIARIMSLNRPIPSGPKMNKTQTACYETARGFWTSTVLAFAVECNRDNPNFQRDRFLLACGMSQEEVSTHC